MSKRYKISNDAPIENAQKEERTDPESRRYRCPITILFLQHPSWPSSALSFSTSPLRLTLTSGLEPTRLLSDAPAPLGGSFDFPPAALVF